MSGESREEFERDRLGQTGYDNAKKLKMTPTNSGEIEERAKAYFMKRNGTYGAFCDYKELADFARSELRRDDRLREAAQNVVDAGRSDVEEAIHELAAILNDSPPMGGKE